MVGPGGWRGVHANGGIDQPNIHTGIVGVNCAMCCTEVTFQSESVMTTYRMRHSTLCYSAWHALIMWNGNETNILYGLLNWYHQHRRVDIIGRWMNMRSDWIPSCMLGLATTCSCTLDWSFTNTLGMSVVVTLCIAVIATMGIVVVGVVGRTFTFERNFWSVILGTCEAHGHRWC